VHEEISVYQNLIDTKYFTFTEEPYEEDSDDSDKYNLNGYKITPAPGIILEGKITIPAEYNDQPIVSIGDFSNQKITHIFFEPGS
jgi:hypothetical protein